MVPDMPHERLRYFVYVEDSYARQEWSECCYIGNVGPADEFVQGSDRFIHVKLVVPGFPVSYSRDIAGLRLCLSLPSLYLTVSR